MELGVALFATDETARPDEVARMAEERGFESFWVPEHTHIPASRETPYPAGGELPREYARTLDPFVSLTAAAAATNSIKLGTGICLVIQRDPIVTAKEVASVDLLSGGRFLFGVGAGWNREEMRDHGTDPRTRMRLLQERVEAMKALWRDEEASYDGEFVRFERAWSWPKPVQDPHPPILVGGNGPTVHDRVLAYGDHWMPNAIPGADGWVVEQIGELRRRAADAGREVGITINAAPTKAERLEHYVEAEVDRLVFYVPPGDRDAVEQRLDTLIDRTASLRSSATGSPPSPR